MCCVGGRAYDDDRGPIAQEQTADIFNSLCRGARLLGRELADWDGKPKVGAFSQLGSDPDDTVHELDKFA